MSEIVKNGEGNEPVQNVKSEDLVVGGHNTKVSYHDNGEITVEEPHGLSDAEVTEWRNKATNEIKALKKANDNYSKAKQKEVEVSEREKALEKKQAELEAKLAELEGKVKEPTTKDNFYGYGSKEDLEQALLDEPFEVFMRMEQSLETKISKKYEDKFNNVSSEMSLRSVIERDGYSFQEVEQFARSLGANVNLQTFNTFKKVSSKAPAKSAFDSISEIQDSAIKFIKGSRGDKETVESYDPTSNPYSRGSKSLNDI